MVLWYPRISSFRTGQADLWYSVVGRIWFVSKQLGSFWCPTNPSVMLQICQDFEEVFRTSDS